MSTDQLFILAIICFVASLFSGLSGGGGGFVTTPAAILLGLPPASAVSSGKFIGLSVAIGSLGGMKAFRNRQLLRRAMPVILLAFGIGLVAPFIIMGLNETLYQKVLGALLLLMIPLLMYKKVGYTNQKRTKAKTYAGAVLLTISLWLQAIFSGGLGTLVNVVLMSMLGMNALEAGAIKRYSQLVMNTTIVIGVLFSGLLVWPVIAVGVCMALLGSFLGARLAIKKGNAFIMNMFLIAMAVSGVLLLVS